MSPASKSKSRDKSTPRMGKEQSKVSIKPVPVHTNGGTGSASAYNPVLGTFHTLEISTLSSAPQNNGRFRTIDYPEDHPGNLPVLTAEYDSLSNNGSCSGESEDQKEKPTSTAHRVETIPGCDNDKRDKIRQKNERKHQRQRERRAQELHERCNALLTSRKVETLSHQLEAMGFPTDRAKTALIINEGRMEESVVWLLHEGEEDNNKQQVLVNLEDKSHIKVDISDELARLAELEVKHKCTKQDVERAVVACEGDLLKAEDSLRLQKQAASAATPKSDEFVDSNGLSNKISAPNNPVLIRNPVKGATSSSMIIQQQRRDEKDLNYKAMVTGNLPQEYVNRNPQQAFKKMQLKPNDWSRVQSLAIDKRFLAMSGGAPSVSYPPLVSPVQPSGPLLKSEPQFPAPMGHEIQTEFQAGTMREPSFIVMRRPKQQNLPSSSIGLSMSPPASTGWHPSASPGMEFFTAANGVSTHSFAGMGSNGSSLQQFYPQSNPHTMSSGQVELSAATGWSNQTWNSSGTTSSLAMPSSLGLFTALSSSGSASSSQNDWSNSSLAAHRDYASIDWSLDVTSLRPSKDDIESDSWATMFMEGNAAAGPHMNVGGGVYVPGLQEGGGLMTDPSGTSSSHEWTNPFEGSDLFRAPRQYVTSPSL